MKNNSLETDHLAVALTRPPMFMGANMRMFFANLILCTLICIDVHTFWGVPLFIVLHGLIVKLSIKEPNFFSIYAKTFIQTPSVLNRWFWGKTNSYEPW